MQMELQTKYTRKNPRIPAAGGEIDSPLAGYAPSYGMKRTSNHRHVKFGVGREEDEARGRSHQAMLS